MTVSPPADPILNSPYAEPGRHRELSEDGLSPGLSTKVGQEEMDFARTDLAGLAFRENALVNGVRDQVTRWRARARTGT